MILLMKKILKNISTTSANKKVFRTNRNAPNGVQTRLIRTSAYKNELFALVRTRKVQTRKERNFRGILKFVKEIYKKNKLIDFFY